MSKYTDTINDLVRDLRRRNQELEARCFDINVSLTAAKISEADARTEAKTWKSIAERLFKRVKTDRDELEVNDIIGKNGKLYRIESINVSEISNDEKQTTHSIMNINLIEMTEGSNCAEAYNRVEEYYSGK